jgi:hypothetical protein
MLFVTNVDAVQVLALMSHTKKPFLSFPISFARIVEILTQFGLLISFLL